MQIRNNTKIAACLNEGCGKIANYQFVFSKKTFCICKSCLNNLYSCIGKILIPKSPVNFLNDENIKKSDFDH